ncbi:MAG: molybdopterin-dependent oxidoreductase, partial [Coriobacteriia bacterium]
MLRRTTCAFDCPDACSILAEVSDGTVVSLRGDPEHGVTRGFLCSQGRDWMKRVLAPDRLQYPLQRSKSGWQRVSWNDALDDIAERLLAVRAEHGPLAVLALRYSGMRGSVQKALTRLFWSRFGGATTGVGGMCVEAVDAGLALDFGHGVRTAHAPEDLLNSRAIVLWGRNPVVTRPHLVPLLDQAKRAGCRIVVIDPIRTPTARRAHDHLAIRPGTDRLLAIGAARILLESGRIDHPYVRERTRHFEAFREQCLAIPLDDVCRATDLGRDAIESLAGLYAAMRPVATLVGLGVGAYAYAGEAVRAIGALAGISGNLGVAGGGVSGDIEEVAGIEDVVSGSGAVTRTVRLPRLGEDIEAQKDPPIRFGWIAGANPAATAPEPEAVRRGLGSLDCLVVVEQFMTATASLADYVLPCATCFENEDLIASYGHDWLGLSGDVVDRVGEAKTDAEIYQELADRLGYGSELAGDAESW